MSPAQSFEGSSRRPPDIEDYIDMLRRYRSWIVGPMFAGLVVAVVAGFLQPDTFVSSATMRITPQQVSEKLLPSVVNSSQLADRLQQLQTEILSRNTLVDIIQKPSLDLYKKERNKYPLEDVIQTMRTRDIHFIPLGLSQDRRMAAFQITFRYTDKYKASAVVRELVSRFESMNTTVLHNQGAMATTFLGDERQKAKEKMDKLSAAITKFEMENQGRLPKQESQNTTALLQTQMAIMHTNDVISRDRQDKLQIQTTLDNIKNDTNFLERNLETVIPGTASTSVKNQELVNLGQKISESKSLLASAKKTYGENYPEITRLQAQIDSLEADRAKLQEQEGTSTTQGGTPSRTVVNPQAEKQLRDYQAQQKTLQTALANKTLEIEQATIQLTELQRRESAIQRKIDEAPLNEQQYAQLQSEFLLAKGAYEDMVKRQQLSETQQNLEEHKAGENLELLDPANTPEKAVDPNRLAWAGIGTFGGMAFGLMLAAAKEVKNTALKNLKDVRAYSNLPVLSSIPLLENALLVRRKRRLVWLAWSSAVIVGITLMSGSMYYYMSS